jgi:hypothetical protein
MRVLVLLLGVPVLPAQTSSHIKRAKHLDEIIDTVNFTDGMETIGGASIQDAVNVLNDKTAFPVSLEMIEFERPKDFVTLDEALAKLHGMQAAGPLAARDKARLGSYEKFAKSHPGSEVVVPRQRTFTLVRNRATVHELLDEITRLDDEYEWKNYGTDSKPVIVIQPRSATALDWAVPAICKSRDLATGNLLAGCNGQECGPFIKLLAQRNMSVMYMSIGPVSLDPRPRGFVDLCSNDLTARDVLNRIAQSAHTSWTLGGIKGMRLISFGEHH